MHTTLSIIGCGKLGRTLGRLWQQNGHVELLDVLNNSTASAQDAIAFMGAGQAVGSYTALRTSDIFLIGTPDGRIEETCAALAASGRIDKNAVVFHCSGALNSSILQSARQCGATVASVHPIRSFARPENAAQSFDGTWCGVEGETRALALLNPLFEAIGGKPVAIDAGKKVLYHGAAVLASNYLVTLLDMARNAYVEAGIAPDTALAMLAPLARGTLENVLHSGPEAALTGPIARGDMETVVRQQAAFTAWREDYGELYEDFVALTQELAARKKNVV